MAFSFQKVRFLIVHGTLLLTAWHKRICNGSQWMVRPLSTHLDVYLTRLRGILHDPEIYPDPEEFKPEHFLNEDGTVRDDPALSLVFGVGRRICPGRHLVDATLFLVAASVLSAFTVTKAKDASGNEIPVKPEVTLCGAVV
jgi:cytochrome P450